MGRSPPHLQSQKQHYNLLEFLSSGIPQDEVVFKCREMCIAEVPSLRTLWERTYAPECSATTIKHTANIMITVNAEIYGDIPAVYRIVDDVSRWLDTIGCTLDTGHWMGYKLSSSIIKIVYTIVQRVTVICTHPLPRFE